MFETGKTIHNFDLANVLGLESDEFVVLEVIRGGMGAVAKLETSTGDVYALKFLELKDGGQTAFERFRREVKIWVNAASCDAVVDVWGLIRLNEIPAVCAEWMPGGDVSRLMTSPDAAVFYSTFDRIIAGLEWVHQQYNIIHRDIKPSNILLDSADRPFISDWGIGRVSLEHEINNEKSSWQESKLTTPSITLTRTGGLLGTIPYCSKEQLLDSRSVDFRSDMYSLGCVMYEWETGAPPFTGEGWEEIARKQIESPVPKIGGIFRHSRLGADAVIYRCLEKNANDRFNSYSELREALRHQAHRRQIHYLPAEISRRRSIPLIGYDQISRLKSRIVGSKGYGFIELEDSLSYCREAEALMAVMEWQKAYDIYNRFYLPDNPDLVDPVVILNMGHCLTQLGRPEEAVRVLKSISAAWIVDGMNLNMDGRYLIGGYFVNLSNALCKQGKYIEAEEVCRQGLEKCDGDPGISGNLTIALIGQEKYTEALPFALNRLKNERNIHSIEEAGMVFRHLGEASVSSDFVKAAEYLTHAAELFGESLRLNPFFHNANVHLAQTLFDMGLFAEASEVAARIPVEHPLARSRAVRIAECLNRVSSAAQCLEFCSKWKDYLHNCTPLLRVEAETLADFYCIGKQTKEGSKVIVRECVEFFSSIVRDVEKRQLSDFGYLARLEEWMERPDVAMSVVQEAHSLYGEKWEVFFKYAWLYGRAEKWDAAYTNSKKACELACWHPPVWRQRSWIEENLGLSIAKSSRRKVDELNKEVEEIRKSALDMLWLRKIIL